MVGRSRHFRLASLALAITVLSAIPATASAAGWLGLRNDTGVPVVIQAYTAGIAAPKFTQKLFNLETVNIPVVQAGNKIVNVLNAQGNVVGRKVVNYAPGVVDQFFSIQVRNGQVLIEAAERPKTKR